MLDISEHPLWPICWQCPSTGSKNLSSLSVSFMLGWLWTRTVSPFGKSWPTSLGRRCGRTGRRRCCPVLSCLPPDNHQVNHNYAILCLETGGLRRRCGMRSGRTRLCLTTRQHVTRWVWRSSRTGGFDIGPANYEFRKEVFHRDDSPLPLYVGGKHKVIIRQEQGLGDTLMCARWFLSWQKWVLMLRWWPPRLCTGFRRRPA